MFLTTSRDHCIGTINAWANASAFAALEILLNLLMFKTPCVPGFSVTQICEMQAIVCAHEIYFRADPRMFDCVNTHPWNHPKGTESKRQREWVKGEPRTRDDAPVGKEMRFDF